MEGVTLDDIADGVKAFWFFEVVLSKTKRGYYSGSPEGPTGLPKNRVKTGNPPMRMFWAIAKSVLDEKI